LCEEEAEIQLSSLVRSIFSKVIVEQKTESREQGARVDASRPCAGSLSVKLGYDGKKEVGAVLPRLRDKSENIYG